MRKLITLILIAALAACSDGTEAAAPERQLPPNIMNGGGGAGDSLQDWALQFYDRVTTATVVTEMPGELRAAPTSDEELAMCKEEGFPTCEPRAGTDREIPTIQFFDLTLDTEDGDTLTFPYAGKRIHTWSDGEVQVQAGWFAIGDHGIVLLEPDGKIMDLLHIVDGKVQTGSTAGSVPLRRQLDGMAEVDAIDLLRRLIDSAATT